MILILNDVIKSVFGGQVRGIVPEGIAEQYQKEFLDDRPGESDEPKDP